MEEKWAAVESYVMEDKWMTVRKVAEEFDLAVIQPVIFLQFCLYGSWDSLGPEFMHPKLKLCIQSKIRGEIFCCVLDFSFKLV